MPISLDYPAARIIRFTMSGDYAFSDVLDAVHTAIDAAEPAQHQFGILDIRESQESRSPKELRVLAQSLAEFETFDSLVVVTASEDRYRLALMLAEFAEYEGLTVTVKRVEAD